MELDMTKGSPSKLITKFIIPIIIGNIFQQLYSMVDTIIVGRFVGVDALAAVGATGSVSFLILGFTQGLYDAGYEVDTCYDGEEALAGILTENYDLVVLDLNLPGMDGMEILKELRQENEETKVLILSARGQIADKVEALDAGANDYMEKPFHLQELEARIRSLTRRKFVQKDVCLESGEIKFDTVRREAYAKGEMVSLTRKENGILEYLLLNMGRPVSQEELMTSMGISRIWFREE